MTRMLRSRVRQLLCVFAAVAAFPANQLAAAEIQLRAEARPSGAVVLLGDVAQILAQERSQSADLELVELFPTPAVGTKRFLRLREVQDVLELRGISLVDHAFSGASQVVVLPATVAPTATPIARPERGPTSADQRRATQLLSDAVVKYLQSQVPGDQQWTVRVQFDDAHIVRVASGSPLISITGGNAPWTGPQQFMAQVVNGDDQTDIAIRAEVSTPTLVVVAVRSLPRGVTIQASDVQLQPSGAQLVKSELIGRLEDAIGRETTQALAVGRPLDRAALRQPLMVRKGEVVTVHVRSPGVQLKTTARARDSGSQGDLIEVESLLDRKSYTVRVRGIQEVEVYARAESAAAG